MVPTISGEEDDQFNTTDKMSPLISTSPPTSQFKYIFDRGSDMKFNFGFLKKRRSEGSLCKSSSESSVRPQPEEAMKWADSFETLIGSKYGQALFKAFLQREFCDENLEFWLEVEDYRRLTKQNKLNCKAQKILHEFITPHSPKEINLDSTTRENITTQIQSESISSRIFDQAQKRAQSLLESDSFPRFLKSDLYLELVYPERYETDVPPEFAPSSL